MQNEHSKPHIRRSLFCYRYCCRLGRDTCPTQAGFHTLLIYRIKNPDNNLSCDYKSQQPVRNLLQLKCKSERTRYVTNTDGSGTNAGRGLIHFNFFLSQERYRMPNYVSPTFQVTSKDMLKFLRIKGRVK
ncbi:hypothetical protein TRIP_D310004 [uncultured Paludibacter sp.]|nr:hypothetical protein TRIP_D310004 [uncultured Paludibacter sp.]